MHASQAFKITARKFALIATSASVITASYPMILMEGAHEKKEKLSIYDPPEDNKEVILVRNPGQLELHIRQYRLAIQNTYTKVQGEVQGIVDKWIGVEHDVENSVKEIVPRNETLLPGVIYIGISGLAGTILTRKRGFFLRFTVPIFLTLTSAYYFLPQTTTNTITYIEERVPQIQTANNEILEKVQLAKTELSKILEVANSKIDSTISDSKKFVQDKTGLKLETPQNEEKK